MAATFSDNTPGLVAILNNRPDFERAREQHWYRIPVRTAPDDILKFRWVAFYLTEDRLWAAMKQENIDAERQWWEGDRKTRYCLDFAVFCPQANLDIECDGDTYHNSRTAAAHDNRRNNFLEQLGWKVLRFNTAQLRDELTSCMHVILNTIDRCGGLMLADETIRRLGVVGGDGSRQLPLF